MWDPEGEERKKRKEEEEAKAAKKKSGGGKKKRVYFRRICSLCTHKYPADGMGIPVMFKHIVSQGKYCGYRLDECNTMLIARCPTDSSTVDPPNRPTIRSARPRVRVTDARQVRQRLATRLRFSLLAA